MNLRLYENKVNKEILKLIGRFRVRLAKLKGKEKEMDLNSAKDKLKFYRKKNIQFIFLKIIKTILSDIMSAELKMISFGRNLSM